MRFTYICGMILLIAVATLLWLWVVGWAVGILLSLFGISVAHNWGMLILVGLAVSIVGSCIGRGVHKDNNN